MSIAVEEGWWEKDQSIYGSRKDVPVSKVDPHEEWVKGFLALCEEHNMQAASTTTDYTSTPVPAVEPPTLP